MTRMPLSSALIPAALLSFAPSLDAAEAILVANFDDKIVGQPVGLGGAAPGEPVSVNTTVSAYIQDEPLPSPNLKVNDIDLLDAGFVRFEFEDRQEVENGVWELSCTMLFQAFEEYSIRVRNLATNSTFRRQFLDVSFGSTGIVRYTDYDSPFPTVVGSYDLKRPIPLVLTFDMEAGTYDITWDGVQVVTAQPHGLADQSVGIGAVLFGMLEDEDDVKGFVRKLVEKGEIAKKDGEKILKQFAEKVQSTVKRDAKAAADKVEATADAVAEKAQAAINQERLTEKINASLEKLFHGMNIATRKDVEDLGRQLDDLDKKVGELVEAAQAAAARSGRPKPAPSPSPAS